MTNEQAIERRVLAGFGVVLAIAVVIALIAVRFSVASRESSDWVNHTHAVILEVEAIFSSLQSAEAASRDYLLTGKQEELTRYRVALADLQEHLGVAKSLAEGEGRQQRRVGQIEGALKARTDRLDKIIQARDVSGMAAALELLKAAAQDNSVNEVRKSVSDLTQEENQLLHERDQAAHRGASRLRMILFIGVGMNLVLLAMMFAFIRSDLALRRRSSGILHHYNEELEKRVKERTAELELSNATLTIENLERRWAAEMAQRQFDHSELIINSMEAGVFVISRGGNIMRANPFSTRLLGTDFEQLIGKQALQFLSFPTVNGAAEWKQSPIYQTIHADQTLRNARASLTRPDGVTVPVFLNCRPMRAEGKVVGAVVTFLDVEESPKV